MCVVDDFFSETPKVAKKKAKTVAIDLDELLGSETQEDAIPRAPCHHRGCTNFAAYSIRYDDGDLHHCAYHTPEVYNVSVWEGCF